MGADKSTGRKSMVQILNDHFNQRVDLTLQA